MDKKQLEFLKQFENLCKLDYLKDPKIIAKFFDNILAINFSLAGDSWEYFATVNEEFIVKDKKLTALFSDELLSKFTKSNERMTAKLLIDSAVIRRTVYQYGTFTDLAFNYAVAQFAAGKADNGEEMLKHIVKNDNIDFGPTLKRIMEKMFSDILAKTGAPPKLSRKMEDVLLNYIGKVKTDERAMLRQRVRELK